MPRVPYFRGQIANSMQVAVPQPVDFVADQGAKLASGFSSLFQGRPAANPAQEAQADYYRAQAFDTRSKTNQAMRESNAVSNLPGDIHVAPMDDGSAGDADHVSQALRGAYVRAVQSGADPEKAGKAIATWLATNGASDDDIMSKLVYATTGKGLTSRGGSEAVSTSAQQALNDADMQHSAALNDANNATHRYGFDLTYKASTENNLRDNATSRANNALDNATSRRGQDQTDSRERDKSADQLAADSTQTTETYISPEVKEGGFMGIGARVTKPKSKIEVVTKHSAKRSATAGAAAGGQPAARPSGPLADPLGIR